MLPQGLRDAYQAAKGDPNLIALSDEVALIDARMAAIFEGAAPLHGAGRLKEARAGLRAAMIAQDANAIRASMSELDAAIDAIGSDGSRWHDALKLIEVRRRLVETETKRRKDVHEMITIERAYALVAALNAAVEQHVKDPVALTAIAEEFLRLTASGDGEAAPGFGPGPRTIDIEPG
jgi:hypothetical protein